MSSPNPIPKTITGGCLCGGVRYQVDFAPNHDWKRGPHTCQCTQCRKNTGTLIYTFHTVANHEITWLSKSTYAEYASSPGCFRAFCTQCGSPLGWLDHPHDGPESEIELAVGTIDEEFLVGTRDEGFDGPGTGGFAKALANLEGDHFWVRNELEGVTDCVSGAGVGTRFFRGSKEGPVSEKKEAI